MHASQSVVFSVVKFLTNLAKKPLQIFKKSSSPVMIGAKYRLLRVTNTDSVVHFIAFANEIENLPPTVDITTGWALGPGRTEFISSGAEGFVAKTSSDKVQIAVVDGIGR